MDARHPAASPSSGTRRARRSSSSQPLAKGVYRIFGLGAQRLGGVMTIPASAPMPPSWICYASTSDVAAALARATRAGGKTLFGPMQVPGGGTIAQLTDPQGAVFALHQAPRT